MYRCGNFFAGRRRIHRRAFWRRRWRRGRGLFKHPRPYIRRVPGGTSAQTIPGTNTLACQVLLDGSGNLLQNVTLTASSTQRRAYFFSQAAFVGTDDGTTPGSLGGTTVTLTIQPGAQIAFVNSTDFLAVNRGSRIVAQGTRVAPIIFTSEEDLDDDGVGNDSQGSARGQWGGLIINGRAPINNCANPAMPATCETSGEGGTGNYGGPDVNDDSGILQYVRRCTGYSHPFAGSREPPYVSSRQGDASVTGWHSTGRHPGYSRTR